MKHVVLYGPQAELKRGVCLWLQSLRELDIKGTVHLRLPYNGVLYRLWCEIVDYGVETAVGHSNTQSNRIDCPNHWFYCTALQSFCPHKWIEDEVDVVGDETKAEDKEVDNDHPQDLFLVQLPSRLTVCGLLKVWRTIAEQTTFRIKGIRNPTVSMKITTFERWLFHWFEEKFSKQAIVLFFCLLVLFSMKPVGRLPESTRTQTAAHTILALRFVRRPLERKGCTMARKRSTLMHVRNRMLPYMFV